MIQHTDISRQILILKMKSGAIAFGGNKKLKIYGKLNCRSGKRLNKKNRIFFSSEQEALDHGYRPCCHCMKLKYKEWKQAA